jgi:hypothetical protein
VFQILNTECRISKWCVLPFAHSINNILTDLLWRGKIQVPNMLKNFQHVSAGPIFGLAGGLRGLGEDRMKHAGEAGREL